MKLRFLGFELAGGKTDGSVFEHDTASLEASIREIARGRKENIERLRKSFQKEAGKSYSTYELVEDYSVPGKVKWYFQKRT
jgi:hypothetical protein